MNACRWSLVVIALAGWFAVAIGAPITLTDEKLKPAPMVLPDPAKIKASCGGKYTTLLRKIEVPADKQSYGEFSDYGYYTGTSWGGHTDLPPGYWVWVDPHWYIWDQCSDVGKPEQPDNPKAGEKRLLLEIEAPMDLRKRIPLGRLE